MIELVATASDAQKQGFFGQAHEIVSIILTAQFSRTDLVTFGTGDFSQELNFFFCNVGEIGPKFFLF